MRRGSIMTTADSTVCISTYEANISIFHFGLFAHSGRSSVTTIFPTEFNLEKKKAQVLFSISSSRMYKIFA